MIFNMSNAKLVLELFRGFAVILVVPSPCSANFSVIKVLVSKTEGRFLFFLHCLHMRSKAGVGRKHIPQPNMFPYGLVCLTYHNILSIPSVSTRPQQKHGFIILYYISIGSQTCGCPFIFPWLMLRGFLVICCNTLLN